MVTGEVRIREEHPDQSDVRRLVEDLNSYLLTLYEEDECYHLSIDELAAADVTFLAARADGELIGCGALRRLDGDMAEVKRMYVLPSLQGQGIGGEILAAIEKTALDQGISTLVLETGTEQPDAVALYGKNGFTKRGAYLDYPENGVSIFMEKRISS